MQQPNFLILCSDEHSRSAVGCYDHPAVKTPTLDRLAARGTRFTQAYTPSPICIPARASLATGLNVFQNCCWSSAEPYYGQSEGWMHRLRGAGNDVVSIGKLHFRSGADDNGFCEEILPMYLANEGRGWPQGLLRQPLPDYADAKELALESGPGDSTYTEYDRKITTETCSWLKGRSSKPNTPWTLFASFVSPHYPLTCPQPFFDLYEGVDIPEPFAHSASDRPNHPVLLEMMKFWNYDDYFDPQTRRLARRCYYGLCSFLDDNIRQVLGALEDSGQADNTIVLYISDHGEMLGNHGFWTKSVMFEDSVAVPMIIAGPGIGTGVNETPVSLIDVAATVEQVAGLSNRFGGQPSASRSLIDIAGASEPERIVLSEYHDGGSPTGSFMIRSGDWKYVYYAGGHAPQLFDLKRDPMELQDLGEAPEHASVRGTLHAALCEILDPEATNARAFRDQAKMMELYGGVEGVLAMQSFNHTPVGS